MAGKIKITIGMPCNRQIRHQTVESLLQTVKENDYNFNFAIVTDGFTVAENRNKIVSKALEAKSDYVLFVDDDMKFSPKVLSKLVSSKHDIIGVYSRSRDGSNVVTVKPLAQIAQLVPRGVFECSAVGGGVLLVKTDVFRGIPKPWFAFENYKDGKTKTGEDIYFCNKARDNGYKVWCDSTMDVKHIGDFEF